MCVCVCVCVCFPARLTCKIHASVNFVYTRVQMHTHTFECMAHIFMGMTVREVFDMASVQNLHMDSSA